MKKKNKIIAGITAALIGLTCVGVGVGTAYINGQGESNTITTVESSNAVKIINVKRAAATGDNYGSTMIYYTLNPNVKANIEYSLTYSDGSEVASDVLTVTHETVNKYFNVVCNKAFTKQIVLKVFPSNNTSVSASVRFDFKEKLTVSSSLSQVENQKLSVETEVETTGGTVTVDKSVTNKTYTWNENFLNQVKTVMHNVSERSIGNEPSWYNDNNCSLETTRTYVGLDNASLQKWFTTTNFTQNAFFESIYYDVSYYYVVDDDITMGSTTYEAGYKSDTYTFKVYLTDLGDSNFETLFDGTYDVIDYSCVVNGETHTESFGLSLDAIKVTSITLDESSYTF